MRAFVNPANVLSSAGLGAGFVALVLAAEGRLYAAAAAVVVAALADAADGSVARRMDQSGPFGSHLDSLTDVVAFGAAPALLLSRATGDTPLVGALVGLVFVLAGAWRLARFQLAPEAHRLEGLPIPLAGVGLVGAAILLPTLPAAVVALALAALMVSSVPFPTMDALGRGVRGDARGGTRSGARSVVRRLPRAGARRLSSARRVARPARRTRP